MGLRPVPQMRSIACDLIAFGVWGSAPAPNPCNPLRNSVSLCLCVRMSHPLSAIHVPFVAKNFPSCCHRREPDAFNLMAAGCPKGRGGGH